MPDSASAILTANRFGVRIEDTAGRLDLSKAQFHEVILPDILADRTLARAKRSTFTPLILRRALRKGTSLGQWMRDPQPRDVIVWLADENNEPTVQWRARAAVPVKWSHSPLTATGNEVAIETLELTVEEFDRID